MIFLAQRLGSLGGNKKDTFKGAIICAEGAMEPPH